MFQQRIIAERNKYLIMQCQIFEYWENTFFIFSDRPTIWQPEHTRLVQVFTATKHRRS